MVYKCNTHLWRSTFGVVVPGKGIEGSQLHPPGTQLLCGIA
jgi:hypothetical protein